MSAFCLKTGDTEIQGLEAIEKYLQGYRDGQKSTNVIEKPKPVIEAIENDEIIKKYGIRVFKTEETDKVAVIEKVLSRFEQGLRDA
jgi:hypothetical protein